MPPDSSSSDRKLESYIQVPCLPVAEVAFLQWSLSGRAHFEGSGSFHRVGQGSETGNSKVETGGSLSSMVQPSLG